MDKIGIMSRCLLVKGFRRVAILDCSAYRTVIDPPEDPVTVIPRPLSRENEPMKQRKDRLIYQSRKRGMLLSTFVAKYLENFNKDQVEQYDKLINGPSNDWDIYYWATDIKPILNLYQKSKTMM